MVSIRELPREVIETSFGPKWPLRARHKDYLVDIVRKLTQEEIVYKRKFLGGTITKTTYRTEPFIGRYNSHGGILAYITLEERNGEPTSEVYLIPLSGIFTEDLNPRLRKEINKLYGNNGEKIYRTLESKGFKKNGNLYVPHSDDEGEWPSKIAKEARILERIKRRIEVADRYKRLGIEPEVKLSDDIAKDLRPAWEGFEEEEYWLSNAGFYNKNNGVIVVVDEYGIPYVGVRGEELEEKLEKAGFREKDVFVPHSNDGGIWLKYMFPGKL